MVCKWVPTIQTVNSEKTGTVIETQTAFLSDGGCIGELFSYVPGGGPFIELKGNLSGQRISEISPVQNDIGDEVVNPRIYEEAERLKNFTVHRGNKIGGSVTYARIYGGPVEFDNFPSCNYTPLNDPNFAEIQQFAEIRFTFDPMKLKGREVSLPSMRINGFLTTDFIPYTGTNIPVSLLISSKKISMSEKFSEAWKYEIPNYETLSAAGIVSLSVNVDTKAYISDCDKPSGYKAGEFYSQSWVFTNNDTLDVNA